MFGPLKGDQRLRGMLSSSSCLVVCQVVGIRVLPLARIGIMVRSYYNRVLLKVLKKQLGHETSMEGNHGPLCAKEDYPVFVLWHTPEHHSKHLNLHLQPHVEDS